MEDEKPSCEESEQVFSSQFLLGVIIFNILCAAVAIPLILLVVKATFSHKLVHHNIKWILIFHLGCLVAHDIFSSFMKLPLRRKIQRTTYPDIKISIPRQYSNPHNQGNTGGKQRQCAQMKRLLNMG
ncbi:hypothetical protein DICVIV_01826 [Dictyocaulus viviparus]|uniref:Uncharacterized protein n=1 Tax=Dictyocaulus viviparus TaxID=29172 RepID=A0A0D8Y5K3_DICVI|nr:hypothetical protein DICVIV_01826 [Dictyocaulus viviparus]